MTKQEHDYYVRYRRDVEAALIAYEEQHRFDEYICSNQYAMREQQHYRSRQKLGYATDHNG